jgi:two-component system, OmpR family, phosphate regulon response regulator PhoB
MSDILIVEDERAIADMVAINLRHAGHTPRIAADAVAARAEMAKALPDVVLLDWMLPGTSGLDLARQWRDDGRTREVPIIMLTARGAEADKVRGLDAGVDDYLSKPFSVQELLARIRAVLRRRKPEAAGDVHVINGLTLDPSTHRVSYQGADLKLGPTEFRLLHFLMANPERVHSRSTVLDRVWGDGVYLEERTVDVHVKRLREALAPVGCAALLETVRGAGYRFTAQPVGASGVSGSSGAPAPRSAV